jgi:hypothetical protein
MPLTLRQTKGSPLTHAEMDANWSHVSDYTNLTNKPTIEGPAFIATITVSEDIFGSPGSSIEKEIIYNSASKNISNGYNTGTGIFTAPQAGFYQIGASFMVFKINSSTTKTLEIRSLKIYKNSSAIIASLGFFAGNDRPPIPLSLLTYLEAGDTLQCKFVYITDAETAGDFGTYLNTAIAPNYFQAVWIRS